MKSKPNLDALFEQARKKTEREATTPLLSEQDVKRLLNALPHSASHKKQQSAWKISLNQLLIPSLFPQWQPLMLGGLGMALLLVIAVLLFTPNGAEEQVAQNQSFTKDTMSRNENQRDEARVTASAPSPASVKAQPTLSRTEQKANKTHIKAQKTKTVASMAVWALQELYVLSDDTPAYNPESTLSQEEKMIRELCKLTFPAADVQIPGGMQIPEMYNKQ